jgi:hypothetical protein
MSVFRTLSVLPGELAYILSILSVSKSQTRFQAIEGVYIPMSFTPSRARIWIIRITQGLEGMRLSHVLDLHRLDGVK